LKPFNHFQRLLLIPSVALVATAGMQLSEAKAEKGAHDSQRPQLSDSQKQQLFETRKAFAISSYSKRLAILKDAHQCVRAAKTPQAYQGCIKQQRQSARALLQQGREQMNAKLTSMGLEPLPEGQKRGRRSGDSPKS